MEFASPAIYHFYTICISQYKLQITIKWAWQEKSRQNSDNVNNTRSIFLWEGQFTRNISDMYIFHTQHSFYFNTHTCNHIVKKQAFHEHPHKHGSPSIFQSNIAGLAKNWLQVDKQTQRSGKSRKTWRNNLIWWNTH